MANAKANASLNANSEGSTEVKSSITPNVFRVNSLMP